METGVHGMNQPADKMDTASPCCNNPTSIIIQGLAANNQEG
jgi:hypothetical protein